MKVSRRRVDGVRGGYLPVELHGGAPGCDHAERFGAALEAGGEAKVRLVGYGESRQGHPAEEGDFEVAELGPEGNSVLVRLVAGRTERDGDGGGHARGELDGLREVEGKVLRRGESVFDFQDVGADIAEENLLRVFLAGDPFGPPEGLMGERAEGQGRRELGGGDRGMMILDTEIWGR